MRDEFVANDVEVWISGLAYGLNPDCRRDLSMFIDLKPSFSNGSVPLVCLSMWERMVRNVFLVVGVIILGRFSLRKDWLAIILINFINLVFLAVIKTS